MFETGYVLYLLIIALGFIAGMIKCTQRSLSFPIVILLGITLCSEIASKIAAYKLHNNVFIYHLFNPIQLIVWGWFFYLNTNTLQVKQLIKPLLFLLIVFTIVNSTFWEGLDTIPLNFIKLESLFLFFFSANIFVEFLDKPAKENIFSNSAFIITISLIWFVLTSFQFFNFFNFYIHNFHTAVSVRTITYLSNYVYYSMLLIAMFLNHKSQSDEFL